jgi:glycyl-tRNA synthetase beta chain
VRSFAALPEAPSLAAANKRVGNILKKAEGVVEAIASNLLKEPAEARLYKALVSVRRLPKRPSNGRLRRLAAGAGRAQTPVDAFFDGDGQRRRPCAACQPPRLCWRDCTPR